MHALPFADPRFDQALLLNVVTYTTEPAQVVAEGARVLRPGGTLLCVTLAPHRHRAVTDGYGHVNAGFAPLAVRQWCERAGLTVETCGVTSRERRKPHFEVITTVARRPA